MSRRVVVDEKSAKKFMAHTQGVSKPKAKAKVRQAERDHDEELGDKLAENVGKRRRQEEIPVDTKIGGGALRGIIQETMARVYGEIWPGMETHSEKEEPDIEIQEEAHILVLTMVLGNTEDTPRRGLKMREDEISDNARYCRKHAA